MSTDDEFFSRPEIALFNDSTSSEARLQQTMVMRRMVLSLARELEVLRRMLQRRGLWDDAEYKQLWRELTVTDHSSAGPKPWARASWFPHSQTESAFYRIRCNASDDDVIELEGGIEEAMSET